jgi:hypothetical protein
MSELPPWLLDMLDSCPAAGNGVHLWLPKLAHYLHAFYDEDSMCRLLVEKTERCGRAVPENEILKAIRFAKANAWLARELDESSRREYRPAPLSIQTSTSSTQWPSRDPVRIRPIVESGGALYDLWDRSPVRFDEGGAHTEEIIDALFRDPVDCERGQ